jgi:asparagine synthase (glutamine-hydrolysing)
MCGIAGVLSATGAAVPPGVLERMIHTLRHRGPDGFGFHREGGVGLAHARLAIIDMATGDQPMSNEDGTVWTVFNGEIFNYVELRKELKKLGHTFRTSSDTETIVHAYEEYGDGFVSYLNGQFAIALWDSRRRRLVLARDRVGVRPLFVSEDGERLLFASEIKALLAVHSRRAALDLKGLAQVFTLWSSVGEQTPFAGIRSVPPGHLLIAEGGRTRLQRYWDWSYPAADAVSPISFDEAAEEVRALLADAVRLQLRADVPVGAYLSGGLDSSALVALIRRHSEVPLRTFSVGFDDAEFDERLHQNALVEHLGTDHASVQCRDADIAAAFSRLIEHTETPILRTAPAPLMILSDLVHRSGLKVVLTGEGADEVFAGYDIFKEAQIRRFWARQPGSKWRPRLLSRLYPYLKHSPTSSALSQSFFAQGLQDTADPFYAHMQRWATTRRLWAFFSDDVKAELGDHDAAASLRAGLPGGFASWAPLARDQYVEANTLLFGYLLSSQGDRVAMANSVEGRVPFLDHRVIEFANSLPAQYKLRRLVEKAVLRHAVGDLLPESILRRVKQPYRAPDSQAFFVNGKPRELVLDMLGDSAVRTAGYFNPLAVRRLLEKCCGGKVIGFADNMAFVGMLSTMILHDRYVRDASGYATRFA